MCIVHSEYYITACSLGVGPACSVFRPDESFRIYRDTRARVAAHKLANIVRYTHAPSIHTKLMRRATRASARQRRRRRRRRRSSVFNFLCTAAALSSRSTSTFRPCARTFTYRPHVHDIVLYIHMLCGRRWRLMLAQAQSARTRGYVPEV